MTYCNIHLTLSWYTQEVAKNMFLNDHKISNVQRSQLWRFFAKWAIFGLKLATTFLQKSPANFGRFLASLKNGRFWAKFAKSAGEMGDF